MKIWRQKRIFSPRIYTYIHTYIYSLLLYNTVSHTPAAKIQQLIHTTADQIHTDSRYTQHRQQKSRHTADNSADTRERRI